MKPMQRVDVILAIGTMVACSIADAQSYPVKAIRVITADPGGGADIIARVISEGIARSFAKPVVVDNRGGAIICGELLSKSRPDGYTLAIYAQSLWLGHLLIETSPFDPLKDFTAVTLADRAPTVLVVPSSLEVKSIKDLIAMAKSKPGVLNFAAGSTGSIPHLAGELFKSMTATNIVHVAYKSTGPAINDVLAGRVELMFASAALVLPHIQSGRIKPLAIASAQPSALLPGVPTVAESGLPGYEAEQLHGVFTRAGTPRDIINRLNGEIRKVLFQPETKAKLLSIGVEAAPSSPEEFQAMVKSDIVKWGKVIKDGNIRG